PPHLAAHAREQAEQILPNLKALPPDRKESPMQVVYPICGGIDVHAKMLVACWRNKGQKETRTFSAMTDDLLRLRDWLVKSNCTHVAIESTGVYWKPVFNILEGSLEVVLVNPLHVKAISGHKT